MNVENKTSDVWEKVHFKMGVIVWKKYLSTASLLKQSQIIKQ